MGLGGGRLVGNRLALAGTVLYFMEWIGIAVAPSNLPTDKLGKDPAAIVAAYSHRPGTTAFLSGWLGVVLLGRVAFYAGVRNAFRESGRPSALVDFAFGAMAVSVAIEITSYGLVGAGAWLADRHADTSAIVALDAASTVMFFTVLGAAAVSVVAGSIAMLTSRLFPWWLSWIGLIGG